eukprot:CAMPEP_0182558942 /NCGR_PEP_ID=MMETSP1324-20130603/2249_1 /TAXON_ID=236786 /ORGANISM="Florenciella sp., Strain RCC1587" /LENGTH=135 /DNA_ID=CAMNT_0024771149 /DNA_START=56 /DNA_END=460 /DNA_ORIENTATION=+
MSSPGMQEDRGPSRPFEKAHRSETRTNSQHMPPARTTHVRPEASVPASVPASFQYPPARPTLATPHRLLSGIASFPDTSVRYQPSNGKFSDVPTLVPSLALLPPRSMIFPPRAHRILFLTVILPSTRHPIADART